MSVMKCILRFVAILVIFLTFSLFLTINSIEDIQETEANCSHQSFMKTRRKLIDDVCQRYANPFRPESALLWSKALSRIHSFQYFFFDDKFTMVCSIQKAGSNSMHNFLRKVLSAHLNQDSVNHNNSEADENWQQFPVTYECWPDCAMNMTNVILVRHPLERLLSAYLYIFDNPDGKFFKNEYTWEQFVQNIIDYPANNTRWNQIQKDVGNHWEPYWHSCQVCHMKPHYILKLETVAEDLKMYLRDIGLSDYAEKFPWINPNGNHNNWRILDYYSRLNRSTVQELFHAYKIDHELFDYDPKIYLEIAK